MASSNSTVVSKPAAQDFSSARRVMVEGQLRPSDVNDPLVVRTMATTPREDFVPESKRDTCYMDRAVPLGQDGRMLNPPLATGLMLSRAELRSDDNALVIGSGTGYMAALLGRMVASVTALEESEALKEFADKALAGSANISTVKGDLAKGYSRKGPYSLIVIDGAIEQLPDTISAQLKDGGRLLTGLVDNGVTRLALGKKRGDVFGMHAFTDSDITPLPQFAKPASYSF